MRIDFVIKAWFESNDSMQQGWIANDEFKVVANIGHARTFEKYELAEQHIRENLVSGIYQIEKVFSK